MRNNVFDMLIFFYSFIVSKENSTRSKTQVVLFGFAVFERFDEPASKPFDSFIALVDAEVALIERANLRARARCLHLHGAEPQFVHRAVRTSIIGYGPNLAQNSESVVGF